MALLFRKTGKFIFRPTSVALRLHQLHDIPCPYPPPLNPECLKKSGSSLTQTIEQMMMMKPHQDNSFVTQKIAEYAPLFTSVSPLLTFLVTHHLAMMAFLIYKNPVYLKDEMKKLLLGGENKYWSLRGVAKKYLAGISQDNFDRLCIISNFIFSPARTMATYKDLFLGEIMIIRKEGTDDLKFGTVALRKFGNDRYQWSKGMMKVIFEPCCSRPGEKFYLVVCLDSLILVDEDVTPTMIGLYKLPPYAFRPRDVSATLADKVLTVKFPKSDGEEQKSPECCLVPLEC